MQVLSSLSGIPFYAPSAAYAPTNGADVSSVASAYAESAASGKLDSSASSSFYPVDNPSGFISGVDLTDYATTAYVDSSVSSKLDATASSQFLTSIPTSYATTDYVDSSISGFAYESAVSAWTAKQDALTFGYDTSNKISSIDGSALAGEGGGGLVTSLQYYTSGSTSTGSGTAIGRANAGNSTGSINYYTLDFGEHDPSCITAVKYSQILITADKNSDFVTAWPLVSPDLSAFAIYKSVADTAAIGSVPASASSYVGRISTTTSDLGTAVRYNLTGYNFSSIKTGEENVLVLAYQYMPDNWGTLVVTGTTGSFVFNYENSEGYTAVSGINELGIYFDTSNCYPTSNPSGFISSVDLSNYATTAYVDSSVSSKLDATASSQFVTSTAGLATTADISGFAYESAVSGWTAKQDALTFGYDTANNISSIDGSAIGGQGGGGGAEYSGIAPIHVDNDTHEISADVVNMDLQQITHDDTMVHVSNSASYALGVNYNYSGAPWNEGLVLKSGLLYSNNNPASGVTSYALSDNVSSYYKLDVNFYDIDDWHTRMECLIPSGILPSGARGGFFNAVANLPSNVWFKCFRWSAIGTNWYCQVDEIAGTQGTNTPAFNINQNANPPKVLSIIGWYKDIV